MEPAPFTMELAKSFPGGNDYYGLEKRCPSIINHVTGNSQIDRSFTECEGTGDILFVVDSSGSVGLHNFHLLLGFVQDFVHHLDINSGAYRVAMIVYK